MNVTGLQSGVVVKKKRDGWYNIIVGGEGDNVVVVRSTKMGTLEDYKLDTEITGDLNKN